MRQGDILSGVPFPVIDSDLAVLGQIQEIEFPHPKIRVLPKEHRKQTDYFSAQIKMRMSRAIVISHCCELEIRNGKLLLPCVAVARLVPVKQSISSDPKKLASLEANRDPRVRTEPGYIDYFYLQPHPQLDGMPWIADFGQVFSIAASELDFLLGRKILQLQDRERVKFKYKLAVYLGRLTDEEVTAGLTDPWINT